MREIDGGGAGETGGLSRRRLLATTGSISITLLAGCGGDGESDPDASTDEADDTATQTGTDESAGGATATPASTDPAESIGGDDGTATATDLQTVTGSASADVSGSVASEVDQLSIVDHRPRIGYYDELDQTYFPVEITVENGGNEQSDVTEYYYNVVVFDEDGYNVSGGRLGTSSLGETEFGPGEQQSLMVGGR